MEIHRLENVDEVSANRIRKLLLDLYPKNDPISFETISQVIKSNIVHIFIAEDKKRIIGMASAVFYQKLGGKVCMIEDVIVDSSCRGKGIGSSLTRHILEAAKEKNFQFVDVYTRREDAKDFYKKLGFKEKGENKPFFALRYLFQ